MKKKIFILSSILILLVIGIVSIQIPKFITIHKKHIIFSKISSLIEKKLENFPYKAAIIVEDLEFPYLCYAINQDKPIIAASIIKIHILAAIFKAIEEGKFSFEEKIKINPADITGGSGVIKTLKLPKELTLQEILELMITKSDNTATNKVITLLGYDYINEFLLKNNFARTSLKRKMMDFSRRKRGIENYTTAKDVTNLFKQVYKKKILNKDSCEKIINILKKQKIKDRIPRYLTKNVTIAHKTGLEKSVVHDAGIIFSPEGNYIFSVLTYKVKRFKRAKDFIAELSRDLYNMYNNLR